MFISNDDRNNNDDGAGGEKTSSSRNNHRPFIIRRRRSLIQQFLLYWASIMTITVTIVTNRRGVVTTVRTMMTMWMMIMMMTMMTMMTIPATIASTKGFVVDAFSLPTTTTTSSMLDERRQCQYRHYYNSPFLFYHHGLAMMTTTTLLQSQSKGETYYRATTSSSSFFSSRQLQHQHQRQVKGGGNSGIASVITGHHRHRHYGYGSSSIGQHRRQPPTTTTGLAMATSSSSMEEGSDDDDHIDDLSSTTSSNKSKGLGESKDNDISSSVSTSSSSSSSNNNNNNNNNKKTTKMKKKKQTNNDTNANANIPRNEEKKKKTTTTNNNNNSTSNKMKKNKNNKNDATSKKKEILEQLKARLKSQNDQKKGSDSNNSGGSSSSSSVGKDGSKKGTKGSSSSTSSSSSSSSSSKKNPILDKLNPFQVGQSLRQTLGSLSTLGRGLSPETKQKYYLDDRFLDSNVGIGGGLRAAAPTSSARSSSNNNILGLSRLQDTAASSLMNSELLQDAVAATDAVTNMYVPEVLVVGATGEVGRLVVRRLLLEGKFQVRVLVRDLYSQTLNLLGTGVSYCQGDLQNVESLEYALTDVDKIVYVAGPPRPDERDFKERFQSYVTENDVEMNTTDNTTTVASIITSESPSSSSSSSSSSTISSNSEWEQMSSVLEVRAELARQVDEIGMKNLVKAYQDVRVADYGTSQAAKRSLFKFSRRPEDYNLFTLLDDNEDDKADDDDDNDDKMDAKDGDDDGDDDDNSTSPHNNYDQQYNDEDYTNLNAEYEDDYDDEDDSFDDDGNLRLETRMGGATVKSQVKWIRNELGNGVFVGKVPKAKNVGSLGGEAAIMSSRLRSREDPDNGIDLGVGFAGFVVRLVADGGKYEAFIRTGLYETDGIEYVCEFSTDTKLPSAENRSRNRFKTVRLPFEKFKPVKRKRMGSGKSDKDNDADMSISTAPSFTGGDVRNLGFRFRAAANMMNDTPQRRNESFDAARRLLLRTDDRGNEGDVYESFYMALSYIKLYRIQPEPEFVYLSDARIPPVIRNGMVRHNQRRLLLPEDIAAEEDEESMPSLSSPSSTAATMLLDETELQALIKLERSPEETYYKYRGEQILKNSGLSYTIIRVAGFNELATSEASTIDLRASSDSPSDGDGESKNGGLVPVSRAEVAQVCVSALLDPAALNKSVYMTKKRRRNRSSTRPVWDDEDISAKFEAIPSDAAS